MRAFTIAAGLSALTLAACGQGGDPAGGEPEAKAEAPAATASATAVDLKAPKAGKWRMTSTMDGGPGANMAMPVVEVCLTGADFSSIQRGSTSAEAQCDEMSVRREGDAIVTHARCVERGVTSTIENRITGDMETRYVTDMSVTSQPGTGPPIRWCPPTCP